LEHKIVLYKKIQLITGPLINLKGICMYKLTRSKERLPVSLMSQSLNPKAKIVTDPDLCARKNTRPPEGGSVHLLLI